MRLPLGRLIPATNHYDRNHSGPQENYRGRLGDRCVHLGASCKSRARGQSHTGRLIQESLRSGSGSDGEKDRQDGPDSRDMDKHCQRQAPRP